MSLLVIMYNLRTLTKCLGCLFTQFLCRGGGGLFHTKKRTKVTHERDCYIHKTFLPSL